jgi:phage terminase small subunit
MPVLSNPKWELFAQEVASGTSASEAYVKAGFKPNDGNARTLRAKQAVNTRIQAILNEREHIHAKAIEKAIEDTGISIGRVLTELAKIGFSDIRKAVKWGDGVAVFDESGNVQISNGVALVGSDSIDDETAGAIAEVSQTKDGLKVKLHDKRGALVDIGRHLGMFKDKLEIEAKVEVSADDAFAELVGKLEGVARVATANTPASDGLAGDSEA